jgi:prophage maintenance system killer protein
MKAAVKKRKRKSALVREETVGYGGAVVIYRAPDGKVSLDVRLEQETVWLSLNQMANVFARDKSVISRHLRNIYDTGELVRPATVAFFATVQEEGGRTVERQVEHFSLDAIISVGYRVNSKQGTQFRMWATQVLREHILKGYSVNERRLKELRQSIRLVGQVLDRHDVSSGEAKELLRVVTDYERALDILDDYDHQRVRPLKLPRAVAVGIEYDEALRVIERMREKFGGSGLFGREKDGSLRSSLSAIMQTFDSKDVYPCLEEKAAHLLYFLVKNHSFVDGNKRIAAALFLWFMEKNGLLYGADGGKRISDAALVAVTLMTAESKPDQKDILTQLIANLLHGED